MLDCFFGPSLIEERKGIADDFLSVGGDIRAAMQSNPMWSIDPDALVEQIADDVREFAFIQRQVS